MIDAAVYIVATLVVVGAAILAGYLIFLGLGLVGWLLHIERW